NSPHERLFGSPRPPPDEWILGARTVTRRCRGIQPRVILGTPMTVRAEDAKAALVEKAAAQVRERLAPPQAPEIEQFVRTYGADAAPEDLAELDLYGAALAHWQLLQRRRPGEARVHVYTPRVEQHGWQSRHSVVEIVTDDMPFLVDSIAMAITRHGSAIHLFVHPIVRVERDAEGHLVSLAGPGEGVGESVIHVEID